MVATLLKQIGAHTALYRNNETGIAFVTDGSTGCAHSAHPNIDESGSVEGMKSKGYWSKSDRAVLSDGYIYNIDRSVVDDALDQIAKNACLCGGVH